MSILDVDGYRSDVLGTLREAMAGPLAAASQTDAVALDGQGRLTIEPPLWEPLLVVAPLHDVGKEPLVVTARRGTETLPLVTFAPWTEAHAGLPLYVPPVDDGRRTTADVKLTLHARVGSQDVPVAQIRDVLEVRLLTGSFGRLYFLWHAETPRLRRLMRQVAQARLLEGAGGAEGEMLDRIGRELAVPRFSDRILSRSGEILTEEQRESDEDYRQRLRIYRPFTLSTRAHVERTLNPDAKQFDILEEDNALQIAFRVVSVASDVATARQRRRQYLRFLRETTLIDPATDVPAARRMPSSRRSAENALRLRLRTLLQFGSTSRSLAPALARTFDRIAIVSEMLGTNLQIHLLRAQQDLGGSRWELGLAAEVQAPDPAQIASLAQAAQGVDLATVSDRNARSLIARLRTTLPAAGGADASWLFQAAGFRTRHALAADRWMLSHFSTDGLVIEGQSDLSESQAAEARFTAALLSPHDEPTNAALSSALEGGTEGWTQPPPWDRVSESDLATVIQALGLPPGSLTNHLRALGLSEGFDAQGFRQSLASLPTSLFAVLRLDGAFSTALESLEEAAWQELAALLEQLAKSGAASAALMLETSGRLNLVVGATGLPLIASNLSPRRTSGFVWRSLPITGSEHRVRGAGTHGLFSGAPGIAAIAVVGYARRGLTDPFEYRVTARQGVELDVAEYELLMNRLRHLTPAGVQANTWEIRRRHVVLDGATSPTPLSPRWWRAFRPFRRPRFAASEAPPVPKAP